MSGNKYIPLPYSIMVGLFAEEEMRYPSSVLQTFRTMMEKINADFTEAAKS